MKLWLGGTALHDLARHLQILGQSSSREPAEAPQRERRTVRVRLEFREETYLQNAQLVEQVRTALRTPTTQLKWQDDSGAKFAERWVIVSDDTQPDGDNAWGTWKQTIEFSFYYFIHTLTTNCIPATIKRQPSGATLDLGAILKWGESLDVDQFDDMKDPRRRVTGTVTASGRLQGNTLATLDAGRNALLQAKNTLLTELTAGLAFQLVYGAAAQGAHKFEKIVRLKKFTAEVDQPHHCIEWSLSATFTRFPDESDYAWMDYTLSTRETKSEGIIGLALRGRIGASSEAKARATLATLTSGAGSIVPADYVQVSEEITAHFVNSADGTAFTELLFDLEWRDTTTLPCTAKKSGGDATVDLGVVERFSDRYQSQLFDEMRPHRKRAGGVVSATGKIFAADELSLAEKQAQLIEKKTALDALFNPNASIDLQYGEAGAVFSKIIRVLDWDCSVNRLRNVLDWTLSATYTRFPNEADYALCEFRFGTRENKLEGTVNLTLAGRIAAPTAEAARDRLARLRVAVIPAGYVMIGEEPVEHTASIESDRSGLGGDKGDGTTFIELAFNDEYQKTSGDILLQTWRTNHADDVKTGYVITTYSGSVTAKGSTRDAAWLAAQTRAEELGADKYPFLLASELTENDRLFQTTGGVFFVTVDFSYRYQRKGARVYLEVTAERAVDTFGATTETVSGYLAAPTLAAAAAAYLADVRNLAAYSGKLLLNERTPTLVQQAILGVAGADQFDRYTFSFAVHVPKVSAETAMEFSVSSQPNLQTLENISVVSGRVLAASEAVATAFLDSYLGTLSLGTRFGQPVRKANYQQGPKVTGAGPATAFLGLEFTETYMAKLTGVNGILECEVTEQIRYSGNRLVEKPIPGGPSLFQNTGTTPAQRVVSGRVKATTEAACVAWAKKQRAALLTSTATYEEAPLLATTFRFLPQTDGTSRGAGANVLVFETSFTFSEFLPEHALP